MENAQKLNQMLEGKSPQEILRWALSHFGAHKIALSSGLGSTGQVLTDMLLKIDSQALIFTIDTGRLHQETYDCMQETMKRYGFHYAVYKPETKKLERMIAEHGTDPFYESLEKRELCCSIRKVEPLRRALKGLKAWICGLRRGQSVTRKDLELIEWDAINGLYKINPLIHWTEKQVWDYIHANHLPYDRLHDHGYPSIGCVPCTRAVKPGEDSRAGRWWWEKSDKKECGLHVKDPSVMPRKKVFRQDPRCKAA